MKKYKITLKIITLVLVILIFFIIGNTIYQKQKDKENSLVIVDNNLSINYMQGNQITVDNNTKTYHFSITNSKDTEVYYYINLENLKYNLTTNYTLKEVNNKLNITNEEFNKDNPYLANFIKISPLETHFYELTIIGKDKLNFSALLTIGIENENEEYFATTIIKNNSIKKTSTTKIGEETATTNEGLIETTDDLGITYYFRGNIPNNYVSFANLTWRIVRINGNGSIKLVLNETITSAGNFYDVENKENNNDKLVFDKSNIVKTLSDWYQDHLANYEDKLLYFKYCVDDSTSQVTDDKTYYLANPRLLTDYNQTFNCLGSTYPAKIGLLSADEVVFAGSSAKKQNQSFYLYNKDIDTSWWTITPSSSDTADVIYFEVSSDGELQNDSVGSYYRGLRPVINLTKKVSVTGKGTQNDPYLLKQ